MGVFGVFFYFSFFSRSLNFHRLHTCFVAVSKTALAAKTWWQGVRYYFGICYSEKMAWKIDPCNRFNCCNNSKRVPYIHIWNNYISYYQLFSLLFYFILKMIHLAKSPYTLDSCMIKFSTFAVFVWQSWKTWRSVCVCKFCRFMEYSTSHINIRWLL